MSYFATSCVVIWIGVLGVAGCGGGCPAPNSPLKSRTAWADDLARRGHLRTVASNGITIKRDVHNFVLPADADQVARAFHAVMRIPNVQFGLIEVDRPDADRGAPFREGSRFQGRYRVEAGSKLLADLAKWPPAEQAICAFDNQNTSDYGVIKTLQLPPDIPPADAVAHPAVGTQYVLEYTYLVGSPIGGSSRFEVTQLEDNESRLTQIFEYQEVSASFAAFFANGGLTLHEQVLSSQVAKTAKQLHIEILSTDMPKEYLIP